jgi:hypothetical protein
MSSEKMNSLNEKKMMKLRCKFVVVLHWEIVRNLSMVVWLCIVVEGCSMMTEVEVVWVAGVVVGGVVVVGIPVCEVVERRESYLGCVDKQEYEEDTLV